MCLFLSAFVAVCQGLLATALLLDGGTTAGVFVRGETPKPLIDRLNEGVVAGLNDGTANKRLRELGAIVRPSTPQQFTEALKADEANVAELLEKKLLKPD